MPELIRTMTVRWSTAEPVGDVYSRILQEFDRLARDRWGFLGYRRLAWEARRSPNSADQVAELAAQVRLDAQFGNPRFVFPEDAEVWEGWATYEEVNKWTFVEEGADHWTA